MSSTPIIRAQYEADRESVRDVVQAILILVAIASFLVFVSSLLHLYWLSNEKLDSPFGHAMKAIGGAVATGASSFFGQVEAAVPLGLATFKETINALDAGDAQKKHDLLVSAWESKAFWSGFWLVLSGTGLACFRSINQLIELMYPAE